MLLNKNKLRGNARLHEVWGNLGSFFACSVLQNTIVEETNGGFCGAAICAIKTTGSLKYRATVQLSVNICVLEADLLLQMFSHPFGLFGLTFTHIYMLNCLKMLIIPIPSMHLFTQILLQHSQLFSTCANSSQTVIAPTHCKLKLHPLALNPSA